MPRKSTQFHIDTGFPPGPVVPAGLERPLGGLRVVQASASLYVCTPSWRISRRRLRSDLLLLPLSGRGRTSIDGRWLSLARGRLVYAPRGAWLSAETAPDAPLRIIVLPHRADAGGGVPFAIAVGLPDAVPLRDEDGVEGLLLEACREDAQRLPGWQSALQATLLRALVAVARRSGARCAPPSAPSASALARVAPALAVMGQDLSQPLRIAELALACGLGAAQFRRIFRAALGTTPVTHLQRLRLTEAQRLIAGGALVREAAEAVGYRSTACLDRIFRRLAHRTPGAWRSAMGDRLR